MSEPLVEIRVRSKRVEHTDAVTVTIGSPEEDYASSDYYCRILSSDEPTAFRLDAYGTTPDQAIRLALEMTAAKIATILASDFIGDDDKED
jgi:hypothetical protein